MHVYLNQEGPGRGVIGKEVSGQDKQIQSVAHAGKLEKNCLRAVRSWRDGKGRRKKKTESGVRKKKGPNK